MYYEDVNFIEKIYKPFILLSYELVRVIKNNINSYFNNFGFLPNAFNEEKVIEYYYKNIRSKLNLSKNYVDKIFDKESYFIYILLKNHNIKELQADFISLFERNCKDKPEMELKLKFYYSDFILDNNLQGKHYYENIENIFSKRSNLYDKYFATQILMETLAYLKDGNSEYAIGNLFDCIDKRVEFVKKNDKELLNLINTISNPETLNKRGSNETKEIHINLNAEYLPFIEDIKLNFDDLLSYELTFNNKNNLILAKENILDRLLDKKSLNVSLNNEVTQVASKDESQNNYYNEKLNKIIYNINEIKLLNDKNENEHFNSLNRGYKKAKSITEQNTHLNEMKVYIYSIFDDNWKFYNDITKLLRINFNRIEDFENIKFQTNEYKENILRIIERKIRELGNYKIISYENKKLLRFYKNFYSYVESKPVTPSFEAILSEDMLNYIHNPKFILEKKIDDQEMLGKARNYFSEYYKKVQKKFPKQDFFVLENLDFLKNNLKIDLDNFVMNNSTDYTRNEIHTENLNALKNKIDFYEKNLSFIKQLISKLPDFDTVRFVSIDEESYRVTLDNLVLMWIFIIVLIISEFSEMSYKIQNHQAGQNHLKTNYFNPKLSISRY